MALLLWNHSGYAPAYAQVSWMAISEDSFTMPTSGTLIRAATVDATVGEEIDLLPGLNLRTSSVGKALLG